MTENTDMHNYKNLIVWKKSVDLSLSIYKLVLKFPEHEKFAITSQIRRSSVSIPSNIAEGSKRTTKKDFRNFLCIASGSGAELETQLYIAHNLGYISKIDYERVIFELDEIMKIIGTLIKKFD